MVFMNLVRGLELLGRQIRVNDYRHASRHPDEPVGIIGKPHVLFQRPWSNPILFGAAVFAHPLDCPGLFDRYPVKRMLVPGPWMEEMCRPYYGDRVKAWPVGIDTDKYAPKAGGRDIDILIYNKILWDYDNYDRNLVSPIRRSLNERGLTFQEIRYGSYDPKDFLKLLGRAKAAIFLCLHETQGLAYQEMLSCGVPLLAWDREGFWLDPNYYPHRVKFSPVSSVPYWSDQCGLKFSNIDDYLSKLDSFLNNVNSGFYNPRDFIVENLSLESCALAYAQHMNEIA